MAKCIKLGSKIDRVSDSEAFHLVNDGKATYVAKHVWKEANKKK